MKLKVIMLVLLWWHFFSGMAQNIEVPIKFDKTTHDFGHINEADGNVEFTFQFTNIGSTNFSIKDVIVSCGCTTPEWTKGIVEPGEQGFINAVFDPKNRPGPFHKSLTIFYNEKLESVDLFITGSVDPLKKSLEEEYPVVMGGIRVKYRNISFEKITNEKPVTKMITVYNEMNKSATWDEDIETSSHISVKFIPEEIPAKSFGEIEITYDPRDIELLGYKGDKLIISTDEWFNSTKKFRVIAFLEEYFPPLTSEQQALAPKLNIETPVHDFGSIKEGEIVNHDFVITNSGKEELNIRMTRASCGCTASQAETSNLKPGESSSIKVTFNSDGKLGDQSEIILVFSNDPLYPTQKMTVNAMVIGQ